MAANSFALSRSGSPAGEPHVYVVATEQGFPEGYNTAGARFVDVTYESGGWNVLLDMVANALPEERVSTHHIQAFYEDLEWIARSQPLVLVVRGADSLLRDVGMSLMSAAAHWEAFVRNGSGLTKMYLVLEASRDALDRGWLSEPKVR